MKVSERNQAEASSIPDIEISNWSENEVELRMVGEVAAHLVV